MKLIKWSKRLMRLQKKGDEMEGFDGTNLATAPVPPTMTLEEKRAIAIAHLNTVEPGKRRGHFALPREHFDPTSRLHLQSYKTFLDTGAWGGVLFHVEIPYDSVVDTVTHKFAAHCLEHMLSQ